MSPKPEACEATKARMIKPWGPQCIVMENKTDFDLTVCVKDLKTYQNGQRTTIVCPGGKY